MDMQELQSLADKITAAHDEEKYTDADGLVWFGIDSEDKWIRVDGSGDSLDKQQMMRKMCQELLSD